MAIFTPYMIFLLPLTLRANTAKLIVKNSLIGLTGFSITDLAATYSRDTLYWPIVVNIYKETKQAAEDKEKR